MSSTSVLPNGKQATSEVFEYDLTWGGNPFEVSTSAFYEGPDLATRPKLEASLLQEGGKRVKVAIAVEFGGRPFDGDKNEIQICGAISSTTNPGEWVTMTGTLNKATCRGRIRANRPL